MREEWGRRAAAEFIGAFALLFIGIGAIAIGADLTGVAFAHGLAIGIIWYVGPVAGAVVAALLYEWLYLHPLGPIPVGPAETGVREPRPGDATAS